jgi:RhoGAP domain
MLWRVAILLEKLPGEHYSLLKRCIGLFKLVVENSHQNGISIDDLASVVG